VSGGGVRQVPSQAQRGSVSTGKSDTTKASTGGDGNPLAAGRLKKEKEESSRCDRKNRK